MFSLKLVSGFDLIIFLLDVINIRIVYDDVIPIDIIIISDSIEFVFDIIIVSIIVSFEKNPDVKGIPINIILDNPIIVGIMGDVLIFISIIRMSWYE